MDNALENFLKTTGWSPEDLLQKLAQYKTQKNEETVKKPEETEEKIESSEESTSCSPENEDEKLQEPRVIPRENVEEEEDDDDEYEEEVSNCSSNSSGVFTSDLNGEENEENNINNEILEENHVEIKDTENEEKTETTNDSEENCDKNEKTKAVDSEENENKTIGKKTDILNTSLNIEEIFHEAPCKNNEDNSSKSEEIVVNLNKTDDKLKNYEGSVINLNKTDDEPKNNKESVINLEENTLANEENVKNNEDNSKDNDTIEDWFNEDTTMESFFDKEEKEEEIEETTTESIEDIRNNLKLQLSSLRNRKKQHVLQEVTTKIVETNKIEEKKLIEAPTPVIEEEKEEGCADFISQTNELGLVILNVEGGVDFDESSTKERFEFEEDLSQDEEDEEKSETSVFAQIRRIIHKPKKDLSIPRVSLLKPASAPAHLTVLSMKKISAKVESTHHSPFVSDELDKFLTGSSNLNISYNVPKSGAEEGLIDQNRAESPIQDKSNESTDVKLKETKKEETDKLPLPKIKAKTLAEKRKLLEKHLKRDTALRKSFEKKEEPPLDQSKEEEIIILTEDAVDNAVNKSFEKKEKKAYMTQKLKLQNQNSKLRTMYEKVTPAEITQATERSILKRKISRKGQDPQNVGYVIYNGEKIYVASASNKLICKIKDSVASIAAKRRKIEEIEEKPECKTKMSLWYNKQERVRYKAGPLSKKMKLELNPDNEYKTVLKKLPRPILEVVPSFGKPMDPKIVHLLPKNDGKITEFQLEFALAALKPQKKEAMTIFGIQLPYEHKERNILVKIKKQPKINLEEIKNDEKRNDIKSIMDDLITYVETKENAENIYKTEEKEEAYASNESLEINEKDLSPVKQRQKRSKVAYELNRLSMKVVNVKENNLDCDKPHCNLGCLCQSLTADRYIATHCKKEECMFECSCPKKQLPDYGGEKIFSSGGILSHDTVHQIDETAKKNLAKVEKEFVHTIICTDDKAIVLGAGDRKLKRMTKAPKKYEDYIESSFLEESADVATSSPVSSDSPSVFSPCYLKLQKLILPGVIPLCLEHSCYKCDCINLDTAKLAQIKIVDYHSARFRTFHHYVKRNRNKNYNKSLMAWLKQKERYVDKENLQLDFYTDEYPKPPITDAELLKETLQGIKNKIFKIDQATANNNVFIESPKATKRKQSFSQLLVDERHVKAIQRRKKKRYVHVPEPVFEGEIIVDEKSSELLKHLETSQLGFARLLPWKALQDNFSKGKVKLWTQATKMRKLYINTSDKPIPEGCFDIRIYTPDIDVCRWLLSNRLPDKYQPENISFILRETRCNNFEVCGICNRHVEKNEDEEEELMNDDVVTTLSHKDKDNRVRVLLEKEFDYPRQAMLCEDELQGKTFTVYAKIPEILPNFKWRMLTLKSDFTYLHFKNNDYSIKYTVLAKTLERAVEKKQTIVLKSTLLGKGYHHRDFGIYFPPATKNNIFIGPYMYYEEHKLETLRYISQCLVDTESYNKIQGNKMNTRNSYWVHRMNTKIRCKYSESLNTDNPPLMPLEPAPPVVDLTSDTEVEPPRPPPLPPTPSSSSCYSPTPMACSSSPSPSAALRGHIESERGNGEIYPQILEGEPKQPDEYNRYIISNIPNFGYLGAYLHEENGQLDVSWPFEVKMLRFISNEAAIEFLETRFSYLLISIPPEFKITITIVEELDLHIHHAMDPSCLIGHWICGKFGAFDAKKITEKEAIEICGVTRDEIYQLLKKRANELVISKLQSFAKSLKLFEGEPQPSDVGIVLGRACDMIVRLRQEEVDLISRKVYLHNRKKMLKLRAQGLIYETNNVKPSQEEGPSFKRPRMKQKSKSEAPKLGGYTISTDEVLQKSTPQLLYSTQNMKSILKTQPLIYTNQSNNGQPKILSGVKIVKSANGKLFLVSKNKNISVSRKS